MEFNFMSYTFNGLGWLYGFEEVSSNGAIYRFSIKNNES